MIELLVLAAIVVVIMVLFSAIGLLSVAFYGRYNLFLVANFINSPTLGKDIDPSFKNAFWGWVTILAILVIASLMMRISSYSGYLGLAYITTTIATIILALTREEKCSKVTFFIVVLIGMVIAGVMLWSAQDLYLCYEISILGFLGGAVVLFENIYFLTCLYYETVLWIEVSLIAREAINFSIILTLCISVVAFAVMMLKRMYVNKEIQNSQMKNA